MRAFLLIFSLIGAVFVRADEKMPGKEITGIVRLIRASPVTEVFFKDLKDSAIIPYSSKHNAIYEACEESRKKGTPVKLVIHPISREVIGFPEKADPSPVKDSSAGSGLPEGRK
jgi:hypothetical protein